MRVFLSETAENKLISLLDYLLNKWNLKVKNEFLDLFEEKIIQISKQPESCPKSIDFNGLFKCVVVKFHNIIDES